LSAAGSPAEMLTDNDNRSPDALAAVGGT
ncbi:MAG: hypothetical protein QOI36_6050, partial [Pseudonocardiales bacterium]|nr:hypothetical protein [Pseudonocardiales bacterium]